jgi:metal-responsive CopG/Arc/MetJ family transcriptional regulator
MRVITINLSTKIVQSIDDRVHEHEWTSRSEFIRAAVNMLVAQLKPSGGRP